MLATREEILEALWYELAAQHPRWFFPHLTCPDSRSGDVFHFATLDEDESKFIEVPFHGQEYPTTSTMVGETSWRWQEDYLDHIFNNRFTVTLKARQLGVSWEWCALMLWDMVFFPGIDDAIYSIKEEDAAEQINRIWDMWLSLPEVFKEGLRVIKPFGGARPTTRIEIEHPDGRVSTVTGMPASKTAGHSRAFRRVLFDETAWQEYARELWKAIVPAVADAGGNVGGVSTANGMSDGKGGGNFFHELYTGAGGASYPQVKHIFLPWHHHPARDQRWYDSLNMDASQKAEQYPADPDEAFLLTGRPAFNLESLKHYRELGIKPQFQCEFQTFSNNMKDARLVKGEGFPIEVYRVPEYDGKYAIGVDLATGHGTDFSVAAVIDLNDGAPCAELRMKADYTTFTRQLHFLAKWYNTAIIAPEKGGGYGDVVIYYLRDGHEGRQPYPKVYRHESYDDPRSKQSAQLGFPMNKKTRAMVISELMDWISGRHFPWLPSRFLTEARTFVHKETQPSPRADDGANDDSVMAWGIALAVYGRYGEHRFDRRKTLRMRSFAEHKAHQRELAQRRDS